MKPETVFPLRNKETPEEMVPKLMDLTLTLHPKVNISQSLTLLTRTALFLKVLISPHPHQSQKPS